MTSMHFKIYISLLTVTFISTTIISSSYQIKATEAENSVEGIKFGFPLNNTFYLDTPFLIDHSTTAGLKPIGIRTTDIRF
jgi:hypothetical protein